MTKISNEDVNSTVSQEKIINISSISSKNNVIYSKVCEKYIGLKLTNLSDFKKIISSTDVNKKQAVFEVPEIVKQNLHKFCRTCAEKKVPLTDIFSEKGVKKRLNQQIQHLQVIDENDVLSTKMCMDCICDLKMSYHFFLQIQKAQTKLQSVFNSYNEALSKSTNFKSNQAQLKSCQKSTSKVEVPPETIEITNIKSEAVETEDKVCDLNDTVSNGNESFIEFDNHEESYDLSNESSEFTSFEDLKQPDLNYDEFTPIDDLKPQDDNYDEITSSEDVQQPEVNYEKALNAFIKFKSDKDKSDSTQQKIKESPDKNKSPSSESSKTPNILKRKFVTGNTNNEQSNSSSSKKDTQKNYDLKEIKIPKLNLEDTANIRTEEDGVMYVTAKGNNPNELLLIKVKKMDKTTEKKHDKMIEKKKDAVTASDIDEQIEEYKKKRVQILGASAAYAEEAEVEEPEIRYVDKEDSADMEMLNLDNIKVEEVDLQEDKDHLAEQNHLKLEKFKQKQWKEFKHKQDVVTPKESAEECTERLQSILKQKDEYIQDFISYLKQRRIVVSRLRDEDIITLYETKNNVVLERPSVQEVKTEEDYDPFEFKESFECDFCNRSFPSRDMEFEHSKIHDFKLMHYCGDCHQEFTTHKAKRKHNITCVQKLMCKYCELIFESKGKKRQHEQKHCDDQDGQLCDLCGEKFKHTGTLDQHVKTKHMDLEKIYECSECPKKFAFKTKLTFHLKSVHTADRPFLCEDCGSDFKNPASLRHHRLRKHMTTNNTKECSICQKIIPIYSMSKHMNTHKAYTIKCPQCEKMFKNSSTLKQHLRIHEDMRQYKCDMCGVGFNRRDGLRLHLKVHEKTDSRGLKECSCQICGEKFPNHSTLVIHRNRTHKDGKTYTCHICNRSMISPRSLEWHLANIHNELSTGTDKEESGSIDVETKRVTCYHCSKTFKTEMILRTHIKNTHTEKEPMKCLDCDQMFMSEVRLRHHMMVEHERYEGTLVCPHCPKRFVNQLRLKTHMIAHSDERPHTCEECGFMLKTKIQLVKHKQNRHSNERPLQCKYCDWRCKQVSALVCHERTHTNERPYSCSVCEQRFKYLGDKNKHERRHESRGGSGFKRIVPVRNNSKVKTSIDIESEHHEEIFESELGLEPDDEYAEKIEGDIESFDEPLKLEDANMDECNMDDGSHSSFEPVIIFFLFYEFYNINMLVFK